MTPRSLARRALWLLLMGLGFYGLGLALTIGLLWVPWAEIRYEKTLGLPGILCAVGAFWIVIGFLPRFERAPPLPPGIAPEEHTQLQGFIRELATSVGHPAPNGVQLLLDANAFAAQRSGWFSERRTVVGIGLPMLAFLDRAKLGSVIAHELGHHVAGDVSLGPWVHRARRYMHDAVDHLDGSSFFLHVPFRAYGELFLRSSLEISRAQELHADALAARVAGARQAANALRIIHEKGPLWSIYWESEVVPVLAQGWLPPLLEGFRRFEQAWNEEESTALQKLREADRTPASEYDSHPSLAERLEALGVQDAEAGPSGNSLDLLEDVARLERKLVHERYEIVEGKLKPITWDDVSEAVWLPHFRALLEQHAEEFSRLMPSGLPQAIAAIHDWAPRLRVGIAVLSPEAAKKRALHLFGAWLALALTGERFRMDASPGRAVRARRDGAVVEPFLVVTQLADGKLEAARWRERCSELGLR